PPALAAVMSTITVDAVAQKASGNTTTLPLGTQAALVSSQPATVTIKSTGTAPATIGVPFLSGANPQDYRIDTDSCINVTLNIGLSCFLHIRAVATAIGSRPATLVIPDNVPSANQALVGLSATGKYPGQFGLFETAPGFGQPSTPVGVTKGADGNIWFDDSAVNAMVRV